VRRGVTVEGLVTGASVRAGTPHVVGVRTTSARSAAISSSTSWDGAPHCPPPRGRRRPATPRAAHDSGFMYFARHYRSTDGSRPFAFGPGLMHFGTISTLSLPADNGTWSVGLITSARDQGTPRAARRGPLGQVLRALPLVAHWLDGEPIDDRVTTISKLEEPLARLRGRRRPRRDRGGRGRRRMGLHQPVPRPGGLDRHAPRDGAARGPPSPGSGRLRGLRRRVPRRDRRRGPPLVPLDALRGRPPAREVEAGIRGEPTSPATSATSSSRRSRARRRRTRTCCASGSARASSSSPSTTRLPIARSPSGSSSSGQAGVTTRSPPRTERRSSPSRTPEPRPIHRTAQGGTWHER